MKQRFSAAQLLKRRPDSLADHLSQRGIQNAQQAVNQLRELASSALAPSPDHLIVWQTALQRELSLYECLQTNIDTITRQMAYWLAQTSGALLTSVGGIGVTLASAITAELGQPDRLRRLACLCSYAGIVPSSKQSGGPEHAPLTKHVKPRCNRILKDYLVQASVKLGQWGPPDLKSQFHHMEANHQHAAFAMAKKLLRLIKCLMRTECVYRPKSLMGTDTPKQELADYYRSLWPELVAKWRGKADLRHVFAQHHPLGAWRQMVQEAYGLKLVLPAQRI